jgi:dTDP-4-dehydrorhamnose reductase
LIGGYFVRTASFFAPDWSVCSLARADLDLNDFSAIRRHFDQGRPDVIIHCAAISTIPLCQANPALARKVNVEATALLGELAADIPFVFFSTDLVFDGDHGNYDESSIVHPLTVYAETKAEAERVVLSNPHHIVIRTSLNGGISLAGNRSFSEQLRSAWEAARTLTLFTDEFRCPIPAVVTVRAVWELIAQNAAGLYHLAGSERLSRWQIGQLLAQRWPGVQAKLQPGSLKDYRGPPRSPDTSLNCGKIQKLLPFRLPGLSEWLRENPDERF